MADRKKTITKIASTVLSVAISLIAGEILLRYYFNVITYKRTPAVDHIQRYLRTHPDIGFIWEPNASYDQQIVLAWADQDPELAILSTDRWGFRNHTKACADRLKGRRVDVVGVGDSFMEMAARPFYEYFAERALRYHSFAMHRQCTPQYNIILKQYALPLKPRAVLYGVFENDFYELEDYEAWRDSGMDWFSYHSGYWCGPPYFENRWLRPKGYLALYRAVLPASYMERKLDRRVDHALERACSDIAAAHRMCQAADADLLVILIPGRMSLFHGLECIGECYDEIGKRMAEQGIEVLNLRPVILSHEKPRDLYYRRDGHWNLRGMQYAAKAIYRRMLEMHAKRRPTRIAPTQPAAR